MRDPEIRKMRRQEMRIILGVLCIVLIVVVIGSALGAEVLT